MENINTPNQNDSEMPEINGTTGSDMDTDSATESEEVAKKPWNRRRIIKIAIIVAVLLVIAGLLYTFKGYFVAAVVNGHPISRLSVVKELERQGGRDALDNLIDKELVNQEAKNQHITISDDEINTEMKKFEDEYNTGGQTLDSALEAQNLTRDDLKDQIFVRLEIQKLLGNKIDVSDDEVNKYITDNKVTIPAGQEDDIKAQVKDQIQQQKLADQSVDLIKDLRDKAHIKDYSGYKGTDESAGA